jgi:hypothetical protein
MTEPAKTKTTSKPPPRTKSGEHPLVQGYRRKLDSIADGETATKVADLDKELTEYLESVRPPKMDSGDDRT